ncbi:helix-turn-helix domain-containing protein [Mycolicibacter minnesotensis]
MENITNQQVGARIANVRGEMKMTQAELASEMSVRLGREFRPLTVTRLEGGKRPIGVDELVAAADALKIKPADLLTDDMPMGSVRIVSAFQSAVRAANELETAVRQWDSAQQRLKDVLGWTSDPAPFVAQKYLERLPAVTRMSVNAATEWTVEEIIAEARNKGGGEDGSSP